MNQKKKYFLIYESRGSTTQSIKISSNIELHASPFKDSVLLDNATYQHHKIHSNRQNQEHGVCQKRRKVTSSVSK